MTQRSNDFRFSSRRRLLVAFGAATLAAAVGAGRAFAQETAGRTARIIVPFAPGAAVDVIARMVASNLSAQWGKTVIVENRPGGRTYIAAEAVARSEADGDTLLLCLDDTFTIVPHLSANATFHPIKELVPINLVGTIPMALYLNPKIPVDSIPALITHAQRNPTALSYGSSGSGSLSHVVMEVLKSQAKIDIVHVPYRGLAPTATAVIAGEVQMAVLGVGSSRAMAEAGRLRPIAIAGPQRVAALPNIPTAAEIGYPRVDATSRLTLAGPARMSPEAVNRINEAVSRALNSADIRKQIEARDIIVTNMGPKPFAEEIVRLSVRNAEAVKISGAKPE